MSSRRIQRIDATDWPTLAVIGLFWVAFAALMLAHRRLPVLLVVVWLAVLGGLYMSLQHEIIHGHPTRWRRFNWFMASIPLGMVQPFDRYRETHLSHHTADLTDPFDDPESSYVSPQMWQSASSAYRLLLRVNRTMAGRLTIGPMLSVSRSMRSDLRRFRHRGDIRRAWLLHFVAVAVVIVVVRAAGMPLWVYLVGFVFGGASLTAMRSFVEHRAVEGAPRSAIVRTGWFFSAIYLNNNLHYTHHQLPRASWFRLPELTRDLEAEAAVADGAGVYSGYRDVARRFLFRPFGQPVHPLSATIDA